MATAVLRRRNDDDDDWSLCLLLVVAIALLSWMTAQAKADGLPTVAEHYDCVRIEHEIDDRRDWQMRRAYFIRGDKVIAERAVHDEMLWTVRDGRFLLVFGDYGIARREITFDYLTDVAVDATDRPADMQPWFGMGRVMTDLRAPD